MPPIRSLLAAVTLVALGASPAFAIQQITIPDPSAAANSGPPDALFDRSVPTTWQKKADESQNRSPFSVSFGSGHGDVVPSDGNAVDDAKTPGSEFNHNRPAYNDPFARPQ